MPSTPLASPSIRHPGPWQHRNISAAGVSFHAALSGSGAHTVIFLHDFPLYWWSWRHVLPAISDGGYRCIAMDLRGYGGSDLQPGQVSIGRLATDVVSVLRACGAETFTVVGAGMGGRVAWLLGHQAPQGLRSIVTLSAPHPLTHHRDYAPGESRARKINRLLWLAPVRRRAMQNGKLIAEILSTWSAPDNRGRIKKAALTYAAPMRRRLAVEAAWETYQATKRIPLLGRRKFTAAIDLPVWSIRGDADPHVPSTAYAEDADHVTAGVTTHVIPQAGHFLSEEAPEKLTELLLEHLSIVDVS